MKKYDLRPEDCLDSEFYKNIVEKARDSILVVSPDGRIVDANQAASQYYGYSVEEFRKTNIRKLRASHTLKEVEAQLKLAQEKGISFRTTHVRRNGELFPVEVSSRVVRYQNQEIIVSIVRDITATVAFETALQEKEKALQTLYQELLSAHEELTASDEELRHQFDELLTKEDAISRQSAILQSIHDTALGLMNRHDIDDVIKRVVAGAMQLTRTSHGCIYRLDNKRGAFSRLYGVGIYEKDIVGEIPVDQGAIGEVCKTGGPVIVDHYNTWNKRYLLSDQLDEIQTVLQMPLRSEGQIIGTIGLASCEKDRTFGASETEILSRFAELASIALDNATLVTSFKKELQERKQAEEARKISDSKYRAVFENANDGIYIHDLTTGAILDFNNRACELSGYSREEILSRNMKNILGTGVSPYTENDFRQWFIRAVNGQPQLFEWRNIHKDGHEAWVEFSLKRTFIGKDEYILAIVRDISERKVQEQAVRKMAYYDALTGLPNRIFLQQRLAEELEKACRDEASGAVFFVDMDDLKSINDTLGHTCGDYVIIKAGAYLYAEADVTSIVSRIGGDEFVILMPNQSDKHQLAAIAENMSKALNTYYEVGDSKVNMTASIGIALYPSDGKTVEDIFKNADLAMYAAKGNGKNTWYFYDSNLRISAYEKMMIKHGLREAIDKGELSLQYQPLIEAQTGQVVSFEALLRWTSAEFGSIPPSRFIPLAEESNLIQKIGKWVFGEACWFAKTLASMGKADIRVAVNVSPRQLVDTNFVATVLAAVQGAGIQPCQLELEITESALITSVDEIVHKLKVLRDFGIHLALDDFGTGYSSLTYLRSLPVRTLKIDKSFIDQIVYDDAQLQFTKSIIDMAHVLNLTVVAEGIEDSRQMDKVIACQCDVIQGYYVSRPVSRESAIRFLTRK